MKKIAKVAFYSHPTFQKHVMGEGNPECPLRLEKIDEIMLTTGIDRMVVPVTAPVVAYSDLLAAHDADYLSFLSRSVPYEGSVRLNMDTAMNSYSWEAAQHAAGAITDAVDRVISGEFDQAFCAVRPPGHHAHRDHFGGFCFINNIAVGALHALKVCGLKKVAVVDFDVHHGDGTTNILGGREDVLIIDGFQNDLFPYAHLHNCPSNAIYTPFDEGMGGEEFMKVVDTIWIPHLLQYQPELILVSAGFDAHREEDQAQLLMVESNYAFIGRRLNSVAQSIPACRGVIGALEGGYRTSSLARSCASFIRQLVCS